MLKPTIAVLAACLLGAACTSGAQEDPLEPARGPTLESPKAPDFTGINHWINSHPLSLGHLKGKVVLVEFWTYDCINCIHVMPHVKQWHERYKDQGLVVVGVHTPEYGHERILGNLEKAVKRFNITYPVAQDNDYATWNAFGNRYWPALYLIDKNGEIVYRHFGEGHYEDTEAEIRRLVGQTAAGPMPAAAR
ncbi:thioredoxin family protein [Lysobacter sp. LF1]|uniref:Thioredoxin family protein n=1 Tax=Lysobacter stagni TaxID=3045172 RepID=A0ABT6XJ52_9GAMM|nr:thioredoxin family protein [Lysobacter sp. LF1]MDI9240167.1 thioredoxin family protein [Lysobacter sp. LF1]